MDADDTSCDGASPRSAHATGSAPSATPPSSRQPMPPQASTRNAHDDPPRHSPPDLAGRILQLTSRTCVEAAESALSRGQPEAGSQGPEGVAGFEPGDVPFKWLSRGRLLHLESGADPTDPGCRQSSRQPASLAGQSRRVQFRPPVDSGDDSIDNPASCFEGSKRDLRARKVVNEIREFFFATPAEVQELSSRRSEGCSIPARHPKPPRTTNPEADGPSATTRPEANCQPCLPHRAGR